MLVQGIKSRPVYGTLEARPAGPLHLFVADAEGAQAILDLATQRAGRLLRQGAYYLRGRRRGAEGAMARG